MDLFIFSVFGDDVVFGIHWLSGLGQVVFKYWQIWMDFEFNGDIVRLHGIARPNIEAITSTFLKRHTCTLETIQFLNISISLNLITPHLSQLQRMRVCHLYTIGYLGHKSPAMISKAILKRSRQFNISLYQLQCWAKGIF